MAHPHGRGADRLSRNRKRRHQQHLPGSGRRTVRARSAGVLGSHAPARGTRAACAVPARLRPSAADTLCLRHARDLSLRGCGGLDRLTDRELSDAAFGDGSGRTRRRCPHSVLLGWCDGRPVPGRLPLEDHVAGKNPGGGRGDGRTAAVHRCGCCRAGRRLALLAIGLFNSIMFPTIFSLACEGLGTRAAEGSGILCVAIVGGAIVPLVTGGAADHLGLKLGTGRAGAVLPRHHGIRLDGAGTPRG